ncbi:MAG: hypothetical protein M1823_000906 [Watsoniomyces obsoletus]|nr:MAG: hypothetical protein M1823_000906 [Watsoniomyces obsoletus]
MDTETIATRNTVASQMRRLTHLGRPSIDITLKDHPGSYIQSYTTLDQITGEVVLTGNQQDSRFDRLEITLEGYSKTFVDKLTPTAFGARSEAQHIFLRMRQPIDESMLPRPRIIESGRMYRFPLTFVVPNQLLPAACGHECESEQVRESHLRLPPSLGDANVSGTGGVLLDDFAPDMTKVVYVIRARLIRSSDGNDDEGQQQETKKEIVVCESTRKIRIVPAVPEDPPLQVDEDDQDGGGGEYVLRQRKDLKKGLFKGKLGSLIMEGAQPKSIHLPVLSSSEESGRGGTGGGTTSGGTLANITVRFDPAKDNHNSSEDENEDQNSLILPRLETLTTRLRIITIEEEEE